LLLGLVIAVTNLDEVVRMIRGSASPAEARAALLARDWPVTEIAPPHRSGRVVEDKMEGDTYRLVRRPGPRHSSSCACTALTALGRDVRLPASCA
jgi:DNA gyrase subunit A